MLRISSLAVAFLLASASAYAGQEPTDHPTQTEKVPAPQSLAFIVCQTDDLTNTRPPPGTPGAVVMPAPGWRDLDLRIIDGAYQCKRLQVDVEDAVAMNYPRKPYNIAGLGDIFPHEDHPQAPVTGSLYAEPLNPNLGNPGQCARVSMTMAPQWNESNPGWSVVGIGCPVPIMNTGPDGLKGTEDDFLIGWKLPECPIRMPGKYDPSDPDKNRMKCKFDESLI